MANILVTGCAGFIGSNLVEALLKENHKVTGIDCFTDYYPRDIKEANLREAMHHKQFHFIESDILNISDFPNVDIVFHLAAQAGVRASWGKTFTTYSRNNIDATQHLLEFYKGKNIQKFVYASSSSVYGDTELPAREKSSLRPVSPYGVTKLAGENLCYLYYKNFKVPCVMLRYFTVYGPRQRPDMAINKFFRAAKNDATIEIYGNGKQTRDFTYISDIVDATIKSGIGNVVGEVFNIGGGNRVTVNEVIFKIKELTGSKSPIIYSEEQKGDVVDTLADISKANSMLSWKPNVDIYTGLSKYAKWIENPIDH
jgi:nucleoside-diphosphate-sugar epimerase